MKKDIAKDIMEEVRQKYNLVAQRFSDSRLHSWSELDHLFDDYIREGDKVLDIGCGNGRFSTKVIPKADYIGIDFSEELIKIAQKSYPSTKFIVADATNLPFDNQQFNLVYAIGLLHHIPSREIRQKVLKEMNRVLTDDGLAIVTVWDIWEKTARKKLVIKSFLRRTLLERGDIFLNWQGVDNFYFHSFFMRDLLKECRQAGLKPIKYGKLPSEKGGTNIFVVAQLDNRKEDV